MIFKCYSSEKLITLDTLHDGVPPGTHFTAEPTEAMRIKCLGQGHNILMPGFEPSYPETDTLPTRPICYYYDNDSFEELFSDILGSGPIGKH